MGDPKLFKEYETSTHKILDSKIGPRELTKNLGSKRREKIRQKRALELLKGYVAEFEPRLDQEKIQLRGFDVKRELYRLPHCVINALAVYYDIPENNTLEELEALTQKKVFSPEGSSQLKKLLTQAIYWRVQTHLFYQNENEIFYFTRGEEDTSAHGLLSITKEVQEILREAYRTLYPLHEGASNFVQGNKNAFANSPLYDVKIGEITDYEDDPRRYREAAMGHVEAAALDPENPQALRNVLQIQLTLGEAQQALELSLERLRILKKSHGDELHSDIGDCKNFIGLALGALGRHAEDHCHQIQALKLLKQFFGEAHPQAISTLMNVGNALGHLGRHEEALSYKLQALELFKRTFRDPHPEMANSLDSVGNTLRELGRYGEAHRCYRQAEELRKKIFGDPDVAISLNKRKT